MDEELNLFEVDHVRELEDQLLWIGAELGTFPALAALGCRLQKVAGRATLILA